MLIVGIAAYVVLHGTIEPFAVAAVDPVLMPACVERSIAAQKLIAQIHTSSESIADELRLLVSKLCCIEADIASPSPGTYRTFPLQFRTSHDMEPASTFVGKCLKNSIPKRDIELVIEKFSSRGRAILTTLLSGNDQKEALANFAEVIHQTQSAMMTFCMIEQPRMDRPNGPRDIGFWEPAKVADLSEYKGISAAP